MQIFSTEKCIFSSKYVYFYAFIANFHAQYLNFTALYYKNVVHKRQTHIEINIYKVNIHTLLRSVMSLPWAFHVHKGNKVTR